MNQRGSNLLRLVMAIALCSALASTAGSSQTRVVRIVPQINPTGPIVDAAVSQDGAMLVAAIRERLFVWNIRPPHPFSLVRSATGHRRDILRVGWNPTDPSQFATLDESALILWNEHHDSIVIKCEENQRFADFAFGTDNNILAIAVNDGRRGGKGHEIQLYLPQTGHPTSQPIPMPAPVSSIVFWGNNSVVCGLQTGAIVHVRLHDLAFDTLRSESSVGTAIPHRLLRSSSNKLTAVYGRHRDSTYVVRWSAPTDIGRVLAVGYQHRKDIPYASLRNDESVVLTLYNADSGSFKSYIADIGTRRIEMLQFDGSGTSLNEVTCPTTAGRFVVLRGAFGSQRFSLTEYDSTGRAQTFKTGTMSPVSLLSTSAGKTASTIAFTNGLGQVMVLSSTRTGLRRVRRGSAGVNQVLLIDSANQQLIIDSSDALQVYSLDHGIRNQTSNMIDLPTQLYGNLLSCLLTENGNKIVSIHRKGILAIDKRSTDQAPLLLLSGLWSKAIPLSNYKALLINSAEGKLTLFDSRQPDKTTALPSSMNDKTRNDGFVVAAALHPDGLVIGYESGLMVVVRINATTGKPDVAHQIRLPNNGKCIALSVSTNGRLFAASSDNSIYRWNTPTSRAVLELRTQSRISTIACHAAKTDVLVVGTHDGQILLKNLSDATELTVAVQDSSWIAFTPGGYFEYDEGGNELLRFAAGHRAIEVEAAMYTRYERALVQRSIQGTWSAAAPIGVVATPPSVNIVPLPMLEVRAGTILVSAQVKAIRHRVSTIRVQINGKLVASDTGSRFVGERQEFLKTFSLPLVPGANTITVLVEDINGLVGRDTTTLVCLKPIDTRTLHIVGIGINDYVDPALRLRFAVADVTEVVERVKSNVRDKRLFDSVNVALLIDRKATSSEVMTTLHGLAKNAQPWDGLLVVFAGHGEYYTTEAGQRSFAFITSEADEQATASKGLLTIERVGKALASIPATQQCLVIDACYAGGAVAGAAKSFAAQRLATSKVFTRLEREVGLAILTSVQGNKRALELPSLGHGLFSAAFLSGMDKGYDYRGYVDVLTAARYAVEDMRRLSLEHSAQTQEPELFFMGKQPLLINRIIPK